MKNKETINFETVLYTTIWEFRSPFSMEDTKKKISEWNGKLNLIRHQISWRTVRNENNEESIIQANTQITVELDTNLCPILCFEEYKMTDVKKEDTKPKK